MLLCHVEEVRELKNQAFRRETLFPQGTMDGGCEQMQERLGIRAGSTRCDNSSSNRCFAPELALALAPTSSGSPSGSSGNSSRICSSGQGQGRPVYLGTRNSNVGSMCSVHVLCYNPSQPLLVLYALQYIHKYLVLHHMYTLYCTL